MDRARVTVVIPTYNRAKDLERALRALAAQTVPVRVCVVDNSSTDDTEARIAAAYPQWNGALEYVRQPPQGPASARNNGLARVTTPFVLFQDSDVELSPYWAERALAHLDENPGIGAVGGYILYAFAPTHINAYGGDIGRLGLAWDIDEGKGLADDAGPARRIWINCSAMLARSEVVQAAGGFDAEFFYAYEDSDLGWRLNALGYPVAVHPELRALHHVDPETGEAHAAIVFHYSKNRLRSVLKNASGTTLSWMLPATLAYAAADLLLRAPRKPKLDALVWVLRTLRATLRLRRAIQKRRTVPDAAIFALGSRRWLPPTRLAGRRRRPLEGMTSVANVREGAAMDDRV